ncbi:hypothetical protein ACFPYI_13795 [Halomarina salina]|uniref:Uncharacterized protein n=1 Tax=Halomarina salina TaxID=1872699 RepID=A0ABD5RQ77_9EURY|nr:hypothetical protein [Halomarina salina]
MSTSTLLDDDGTVTDHADTIPHDDVAMWFGDDGLKRIDEETFADDEYVLVCDDGEWMALGRRKGSIDPAPWTIIDVGGEDHSRNVFARTVGR